jgi:metacaspase-1
MDHRIVWVHGIGAYTAGYSTAWKAVFDPYMNFPDEDFIEVLWADIFNLTIEALAAGAAADAPHAALTRKEQLRAAEVQAELEMLLTARASAFAQGGSAATRTAGAAAPGPIERSQHRAAAMPAGLPNWLPLPHIHIGEFVQYLVSQRVRTAVKEKMKAQLRPLAGGDFAISVVAHSWGTVVAYDTLLDMESEQPDLRIANLFTLGSPLWAVRHLLDDSSGRKPGEMANWANIEADGDFVGSWLSPGFAVDHDYEVPDFGGGDSHGSYFVAGNTAVQHDIVAGAILP